MCEHKIQSSSGLHLDLKQVPKMLLELTKKWAKNGFTVSFKLETDQELVVLKSKAAIAKYGVSLVVANQLQVVYNFFVFVFFSFLFCFVLFCFCFVFV